MPDFKKLYSAILLVLAVIVQGPVHGDVWAETPEGAVADSCKDSSEQEGPVLPSWFPRILGAQVTTVCQSMPAFHSPYEGPNSLRFQNGLGRQATETYGGYVGAQLAPGLQVYADGEFFQGNGVGHGIGLSGYVNGDLIRAGSSDLPKVPYLARLFLRYYYPLSGETEKLERGIDQLPGEQPVSRCEIKAGKLAATDDFDLNRYANNNRTQFFNYDFLYNTAWDYAARHQGIFLRISGGPVSAAMEIGIWRLYGTQYRKRGHFRRF